jgi:hypothetical protein
MIRASGLGSVAGHSPNACLLRTPRSRWRYCRPTSRFLTNREADVAMRVVSDRIALPLNLHGLKGPDRCGGVRMSRDLLAAWRAGPDPIQWVVKNIDGIPDSARGGSHHRGSVRDHGPRGWYSRARHDDAALLRRRCRPAAGEDSGRWPAHPRHALAPHASSRSSYPAGSPRQDFPPPTTDQQ